MQKGLDMRVFGSIISQLTAHSSQLTAHSSQLGVARALINGQLFFTHILIFPHTLLHAAQAAFYFLIIATAGVTCSGIFCTAAMQRQRSDNPIINTIVYRTVSIARGYTVVVGTMCTVFRQGWQIKNTISFYQKEE